MHRNTNNNFSYIDFPYAYKKSLLSCVPHSGLSFDLNLFSMKDIQNVDSNGLLKKNKNIAPNHFNSYLIYTLYTTF